MKFLEQHQRNYLTQRANYEALAAKLRAQIDSLEQKLAAVMAMSESTVPPSWAFWLVLPLANEIAKHFPGSEARVSPPSGMGSRVLVSLFAEGSAEGAYPRAAEGWLGMIVFAPGAVNEEAEIKVIDLNTNTGRFPPGTLGDMSGLNHPYHSLPDTVEELIAGYFHPATSSGAATTEQEGV